MNRDYFTKPAQDSRSAHDYGRSNVPFERDPYCRTTWWETLATMIVIASVAAFFIFR
jgi:hypothetical protein